MTSRPAPAPAAPVLLDLHQAAFAHGDHVAVRGVDLRIRPGEVVALLGPNGSGKSTLVRGILGLVDLVGGTAEVLGHPVGEVPERSHIGYVPQRHTVAGGVRATVSEVVAEGRVALRPWWKPANRADREAVRRAIAEVDLAGRERADIGSLSGGQQRRVLIARALAGDPALMLMDEPTAGVDLDSQRVLAEVIRGIAERGTGLLIVTHELAALHEVVTRIVCLDAGLVDFDGPPQAWAAHAAAHPAGHHHADLPPPPRTGLTDALGGPEPSTVRRHHHG